MRQPFLQELLARETNNYINYMQLSLCGIMEYFHWAVGSEQLAHRPRVLNSHFQTPSCVNIACSMLIQPWWWNKIISCLRTQPTDTVTK